MSPPKLILQFSCSCYSTHSWNFEVMVWLWGLHHQSWNDESVVSNRKKTNKQVLIVSLHLLPCTSSAAMLWWTWRSLPGASIRILGLWPPGPGIKCISIIYNLFSKWYSTTATENKIQYSLIFSSHYKIIWGFLKIKFLRSHSFLLRFYSRPNQVTLNENELICV